MMPTCALHSARSAMRFHGSAVGGTWHYPGSGLPRERGGEGHSLKRRRRPELTQERRTPIHADYALNVPRSRRRGQGVFPGACQQLGKGL